MVTDAQRRFNEALARMDTETLTSHQGSVCGLDAELRLALVTGGWHAFAHANDGASVLTDYPVGRPLLDAVPEPIRSFYGSALRRCLETGETWTHDYSCPSPTQARTFRLRVHPMPQQAGLICVHSLRVERPHPDLGPAPLLRGDLLVQCCHCRRFRTEQVSPGLGQWTFVGAWLAAAPRPVTHGLCGPCTEHYYPA